MPLETEEIRDSMEERSNKHATAYREEGMVRELDDWKWFQQTRIKNRPGENLDLLNRIMKMSPDNTEGLVKKYGEFQLRQKITPRIMIKDIFVFEQQKNDYVLQIFNDFEKSLKKKIMMTYEMLTSQGNYSVKLQRQIDNCKDELENFNNGITSCKLEMKNRKIRVKNQGKLAELRKFSILKHSSTNQSATDRTEPTIPIRIETQVDVDEPSKSNKDTNIDSIVDIFDYDPKYAAKKKECEEYAGKISGVLQINTRRDRKAESSPQRNYRYSKFYHCE